MRIWSLTFNDFRAFRGEQHVSFVDKVTGAARPLSTIAGTNGAGKTTILEAIEALVEYVVDPDQPRELVSEAWETGYVALDLELAADEQNLDAANPAPDPLLAEHLTVAVGRRDKSPAQVADIGPGLFCRLVQKGVAGRALERRSTVASRLRKSILKMRQGSLAMHGGLLYFPNDRALLAPDAGSIEPPPEERQWLCHLRPSRQWSGHLEQMWVWQNYLDLEEGQPHRPRLHSFTREVSNILGPGRDMTIKGGRAYVQPGWAQLAGADAPVRVSALPSGEQQILLLVGEAIRRARAGMVVMIDEPEMSLHPALQRVLVDYLRRFARAWDAQVIMATHSVEIVKALHSSELVNLDFLVEEPVGASHE